jgi:O-antigen/teichoic acid export membrane protein
MLIVRAIAVRSAVYGSSFIALVVFGKLLGPTEYGRLSYIQALAEVAILIATWGAGLLYTGRTDAAKKTSPRVGPTLLSGLALGLPAFTTAGWLKGGITAGEIAAALLFIICMACLVLHTHVLRGLGFTSFFASESAMRVLLGVVLAVVLGTVLQTNVITVVSANALATLGLVGLAGFMLHQQRVKFELPIPMRDRLTMLGQALATFVQRKADALLIALVLPFSALGDYKVALVFGEVAFQLAQAHLVLGTSVLKDAAKLRKVESAAVSKLFRETLAITAGFSAGVQVAAMMLQSLVLTEYAFAHILPYFIAAYAIKVLSLPTEQLMVYSEELGALRRAGFLSAAAKILLITLSASIGYGYIGPAVLGAAVCELVIYQRLLRTTWIGSIAAMWSVARRSP